MKLLSVQAAQQRILKHLRSVEAEDVRLDQSAGRVLARGIRATDLPLFDNSSVDGFAVISADLSAARRGSPRMLRVVADIPAGSGADVVLARGQAARIMTGAPIPRAADAVIMVEDTDFFGRQTDTAPPSQIGAFRSVAAGENVRRRGMDVRRGHAVFAAGHRLRPQDLGLLAMLNVSRVPVFRRPRVALLSSGDELVAVDRALKPGKIRDSNSYILKSLISEAGCAVLALGIAADKEDAIEERLERAVFRQADVIVSSAGVSVGALDLIRKVVEAHGGLDFWKVNVRPGKPLAVGAYRGIPFIGLPGNPVSAFVGFKLFVRPALARLAGLKAPVDLTARARLTERVESDGRESYLRSIVEEHDGEYYVKLTGHQGSGNLLSLVEANALLIVPAGVKSLAVGERVAVWLL